MIDFNPELLNIQKDSSGKVVSFDIVRSQWYRGRDEAALLNTFGDLCCLGFYALACGVPPEAILGAGLPDEIYPLYWKPEMNWLIPDIALSPQDILVNLNDNPRMGDAKRESKIKEIFWKHGITVNFI